MILRQRQPEFDLIGLAALRDDFVSTGVRGVECGRLIR
jgi:hypothetical protein